MSRTIEITKEMEERSRDYRLALHYMNGAHTEESAAFFRASAERHRIELGRLLDFAINNGDPLPPSLARAMDIIRADEMSLAVAVPPEAQREVGT